ncbi:hypothetical protein [Sinorhizobium meliloti]|uniref:hypothetical protein n=1 Tax=Rhizobium meliloti TaxID=382 RepID=UPI003D661286
MNQMTNLPAQLSTLRLEISAITDQLAPVTSDEIGQCIDELMSGGMRLSETITAPNPIAEYRFSLRNVPVYGLRHVFLKLKRGEYENINLAFIPLPNEMAAMANEECRLLREDRIRKQETLNALAERRRPVQVSVLHDLCSAQRERSAELASQGYVLVADGGVTHDAFSSLAKSRAIPAGSLHLWALDEVWAPAAVAGQVDTRMVDERTKAVAVARETTSPERAAALEKMLALPEARNVGPEQTAHRRKCEADSASVGAVVHEWARPRRDGKEGTDEAREQAQPAKAGEVLSPLKEKAAAKPRKRAPRRKAGDEPAEPTPMKF